jgi:hypothetical protein
MSLAACTGGAGSAQPRTTDTGPAAVTGDVGKGPEHARAAAVLRVQQQALRQGRDTRFVSTWASGVPGARGQAREIVQNLHALRATVSLNAVPVASGDAAAPPVSSAGRPTWKAGVDVTWTTPPMQGRTAVSKLIYTFVSLHRRAAVVDVRAAEGSREPIWLAGRLQVRRGGPDVVATASTEAAARELVHRLQVARREIRHFFDRGRGGLGGSGMPGWHEGLVAYLPRTAADYERIVGGTPRQYGSVAAVTSPVGDSTTRDSPVVIVVNPRIWPHLRGVGAHVVITHEAVHAATGAVTPQLPTWVAEGFADYVAVRAAGVPAKVASAQAIKDVRAHGVPGHLPADADFDTTNPSPERAYELSRLAIATIATDYGHRRLIDFYTGLVTHPGDLAAALHGQLGTSKAVLTDQWHRLLVRLAGAQ